MDDVPLVNVLQRPTQLHEETGDVVQLKRLPVPRLNCLVQVALFAVRHDEEITRISYFKPK